MIKNQSGNYDIIGDIHGHANDLKALLQALDYQPDRKGIYRHPERKVIFVGDFIDRGDGQKAVLDMVRPMVEQGAALAVMGNHEFNAIAYHTQHPETGQPLRSHDANHTRQHEAFLKEFTHQSDINNCQQLV